jgi:hypothetical protein
MPGALTAGAPEIELPSAGAALPLASPLVPIYGTSADPAVLAGRFDKGRVIWWAGAGPLLNDAIAKTGHVELLVNSLGPTASRTVLWDEFYHGHGRSLWSYLAGTPLPFAILQVAGLAGLALFTFSRRRQPIRALVVESRTSPLEFIDTMGGLYERARAANAAVATVRTWVRRQLLEAAGLPPATPDERLCTVIEERLAIGPEVATIMNRARELSNDYDAGAAEAVAVVADLQALAAKAQAAHRQKRH